MTGTTIQRKIIKVWK